MPQLSVVTPCARREPAFLADARRSLEQLALPTGWELEWLVQQDGEATEVADALPAWARYAANGYQEGAAATRNLALARARGELVVALDDDDMVSEGMAALVAALAAAPWAGWAAGRSDDLVGEDRVAFPLCLPAGRVRAGEVFDAWADGVFPLVCSGAVVCRTEAVRAAGGWPALPIDEDTAVVCLVTEEYDGLVLDEVVHVYRRHTGSNDKSPRGDSYRPTTHQIVRDMVTARRLAVARAGADHERAV